jgi:hypothetical protein
MIATALSKPSNKAIFFNNVSVLEEIFDGSNSRKSEFTKLSINFESYSTV